MESAKQEVSLGPYGRNSMICTIVGWVFIGLGLMYSIMFPIGDGVDDVGGGYKNPQMAAWSQTTCVAIPIFSIAVAISFFLC